MRGTLCLPASRLVDRLFEHLVHLRGGRLQRRIVPGPVPHQPHVEFCRRQQLLQIVMEDLRHALAFAILRHGHIERQLLQLPGSVPQFRRALGHFALQRRRQLAQRLFCLPALGDILDEDDEILRPARLVALDGAGQIDPDRTAVPADVAFLNRVMIDPPLQQMLHLDLFGLPVIGKRDLLTGLAEDILGQE